MAARSLRAHLLRMLLPPIGALLVLGALVAYYPSLEPATTAYDQGLIDAGISLGTYIHTAEGGYRLELPSAVDQVLRRDSYDSVYYRVLGPNGEAIAGDDGLPGPPPERELRDGFISYDTAYKGQKIRAVAVPAKCGEAACSVVVAETTVKRRRMTRDILFSSLLPEILIAIATVLIVWFGVKRGLGPLARLSDEIKKRSPGDLRPIAAADTPEEARPLVSALNGLLDEVAQASRNQQRFLANAAHQLRTPLAGLQAHTELTMAKPLPADVRAELEQVHQATIRTARLANQLLALARAEPGARGGAADVNLKLLAEVAATSHMQQRFLADAAHQLRTPLTGLQMHTELALAEPMPDECRAQLEQVHRATIRTARLANQLLALARAEPGARSANAGLDLKSIAGGEADAWVRQAVSRDIDLGFELESARIDGDAFLLREALANLVHNALEYSPRGGRVTVRTGRRNGHAFLEVEDDGPGIAPPERERVVERFYRVPGTPGTGSGLGLAIVREIAAGHGANLAILDSAAGGCRVGITFPHG